MISSSRTRPFTSPFDGWRLPVTLAHQIGHVHLQLLGEIVEGTGLPSAGSADDVGKLVGPELWHSRSLLFQLPRRSAQIIQPSFQLRVQRMNLLRADRGAQRWPEF